MKTITIKGWIPAGDDAKEVVRFDKERNSLTCLYATKGTRNMYDDDAWPPKRVTITIQVND